MDQNTFQAPVIAVRLNVQATSSTPILACMLGELLKQHGAEVTYTDERCNFDVSRPVNLAGLKVNIGQLTHVTENEAVRW
jgi:hypothetical protein